MSWLTNIFGVARSPSYDTETQVLIDNFFASAKGMLTQYGITIVANYIARTFMDLSVHSNPDNGVSQEALDKLNLTPNKNQNAAEFWRDVVFKLITENEVLVVTNDTKDLLVADSFTTQKWTNFGDRYQNVQVNEYTFKRTFQNEEVWHITLTSTDWQKDVFSRMTNELDSLYANVLGNAKLKNQLRAVLKVEANANLSKEQEAEKLQSSLVKIKKAIESSQIAIFPEKKGLTYEEKSSQSNVNASSGTDELAKLKHMVISDAANFLGVPDALLFGEQADKSGALSLYRQDVVKPIKNLLQSELSKKLKHLVTITINNDHAIVDNAEKVDKLISSGMMTRNMVAELFDLPPVAGGDEFVITKNYEQKGGGSTD